MTDMPERIRVSPTHRPSNPHDLWVHEPPYHGRGTEYVRADLLDAANARIAELEDKLELERALSDGAHRRARNARDEALEEAAKVADAYPSAACMRQSTGEKIAATIRALKGGSNG